LKGCGLARPVMSDAAVGRKTAWAWAVATFLGAGLLRPGPGTWASAAAALLWLAAAMGLHLAPGPLAWLTLAAALGALAIGIPAATRVEQESGREDPGHVVIDEVAGQWIALIHSRVNLSHLLAGFLFFRLFDIVKPWPARQLEGLPAGWGIMLDDVAAGVYALLLMQALQHWIG
jgi:phosphatidylglycerophosphatase A